jgi:hypothetical protein
LTDKSNTRWIDEVWYQDKAKGFFADLCEEDTQTVLENLLLVNNVDFHTEAILGAIARRRPALVWAYFGERLRREREREEGDRYEAIPYQFSALNDVLSQTPELGIGIVRRWYDPERRALFQFEGGRLLHGVFPEVSGRVEAGLMQVIAQGTPDDFGFVLGVLRNYKGDARTHAVMKAIAAGLPDDAPGLDELEACLFDTGVVLGEFGIAEAYRAKKGEITGWLEDEPPASALLPKRPSGTLISG